ncbi:MAG: flagellar hook-associated protein FlgL [Pseudomonadota bacterium]
MAGRASTNQIFDSGLQGIENVQSRMLKTQQDLSTGKRVRVPSDDPVAAARILEITQSVEVNNRHIENQAYATSQLSALETKFGQATETMQDILDRSVQVGNSATLSDGDRQSIAVELRQKLAQLLSIANAQDANGQYMFSGSKSATQPFNPVSDPVDASVPASATPHSATNSYATYSGDQTQQRLQVDSSRIMPTTETGFAVFMRPKDKNGNLTTGSVFDAIKNLIDTVEKPSATNTTFQTDLAGQTAELRAFLDNTVRLRAAVGARLDEIDSLGVAASATDEQLQTSRSNLEDLDYAKAISEFTQQQTMLQAAQKTFRAASDLSLFNLI